MNAEDVQVARAWARRFFIENPEASIDDAARAAYKARHGMPKSIIAEVRRDVRAMLEAEKQAQLEEDREEQQRKQQQLRVVQQQRPPDKPPLPPPPRLGTGNLEEDIEERRRFLNDLVENRPLITIAQAQAKLGEEFGVGLETAYVADTLRVARELMGVVRRGRGIFPAEQASNSSDDLTPLPNAEQLLQREQPPAPPQQPTAPPPPPEPMTVQDVVRAAARAMKTANLRRLVIELNEQGEVSFDGELFATTKGKLQL